MQNLRAKFDGPGFVRFDSVELYRADTHTHTHPHTERQRNSRTDRALNSWPTSRLPTASEMTSNYAVN